MVFGILQAACLGVDVGNKSGNWVIVFAGGLAVGTCATGDVAMSVYGEYFA